MMTFDVEVLLKGTNEVVAETVTFDGPEPAGWTDADVREVLLSTLRVFDRVNSADGTGGDEVSLRGLSWIVTDADPGARDRDRDSEWRGRLRAVRAAGRRADPDDRAGDLAGSSDLGRPLSGRQSAPPAHSSSPRGISATTPFRPSPFSDAPSALNFNTAVRDPHWIRHDALGSRWSLDVTIAHTEAGTVPRAGHDVVF